MRILRANVTSGVEVRILLLLSPPFDLRRCPLTMSLSFGKVFWGIKFSCNICLCIVLSHFFVRGVDLGGWAGGGCGSWRN